MPTGMTFVQGVTLAIAVIGAVLGLINTWHGLSRSRVKLLVRPKHAIPFGSVDPRITFCIEVINLSEFAVTVDDVGVFYKGTTQRGSIVRPLLADGGSWPRRLEPRSSVTVYSETPTSLSGAAIRCAYAMTQCGYFRTGTTPALKQLAERA